MGGASNAAREKGANGRMRAVKAKVGWVLSWAAALHAHGATWRKSIEWADVER